MKSFKDGIGPALALVRQRAGISQSELARRREKSDQPRLSQFERGEKFPPTAVIDDYLKHCGSDIEDLAAAFLGPDPSEDEVIHRALRALQLDGLSPDVEELAIEQIRNARRTYRKFLEPDAEEDLDL